MDKVIVSNDSYTSDEPYNIILSNISFLNLLRAEDYQGDFCDEAEVSYYVDYYLCQLENGGFSQFVYNSGWNEELLRIVEKGLSLMSAQEHLAYFKKQVDFVNHYDELKLAEFLESDYFGKNPTRDALNNAEYDSIQENLVALNASWLRSLPNLQVLSIEEMFQVAEQLVGHTVNRS